jgi:hypothetical protein
MRKCYALFFIPFTLFAVMYFSSTSPAEVIKCHQCSRSSPCVTVLEFKNVKLAHDIFCSIDKNGDEHWDSEDASKLELFYFFDGDQNVADEKNEIEI